MKCVPIGIAPVNEAISSGGGDDQRAKLVAEAFARQLVRQLGPPPPGVRIAVDRISDEQTNPYCAVCYYDEHDANAVQYAWRCEDHMPLDWDETARAELTDKK